MPNRPTHRRRRRDETFVAPAVWTQFIRNQLTTIADGFGRHLETDQTEFNRLHGCLTTWILIDIHNFFNNDDIMTSLLKKLSISIKIGVIKRYGVCLVSFQIYVDRIRRQSWVVVS